jgi:two-component system cell cycle sensor histidine kinase/response regulator CckA
MTDETAIAETALDETLDETMIGGTMMGERTTGGTIIGTMTGAVPGAVEPWGAPQTILLVEDEAFVRKVAADVLDSAGYRVLIASSATEAFEIYARRSEAVDLLLCDVVLPGMSGPVLAVEFQRMCPRARILLMSGYAEELARCDRSCDSKKYLAKPFSIGTLLSRVREALDKSPAIPGLPS